MDINVSCLQYFSSGNLRFLGHDFKSVSYQMFFVLILSFLWPSLNILLYPFPWGFHSQGTSKALYQSSNCIGCKGTRHPCQHPCHEPFTATKGSVFVTRLIISQSWCRGCQIHCWRTRIIWTFLFEMERCQGLQTKSPVNWLMIFTLFFTINPCCGPLFFFP